MKLKTLKKLLDRLTKEELEQELLYNSEDHCMSGIVQTVVKARANLYYMGDDDPSTLVTLKYLKEEGYDKEDIESMDIEIPKGSFYIKF